MQFRTPLQHLASITNAQKSTGPQTEAGKANSSENARKHGLSSRFAVLPWENPDEYGELHAAFAEEFPPANDAEKELLDSLAQARWLVRRAISLQELCFESESPTCFDPTLSLYLRYQSTHERSFHKAHAMLKKIKAERKKTEQAAAREENTRQLGFVLQKRQADAEIRKQEQHEASLRVKNATVRLKEVQMSRLQNGSKAANPPQSQPEHRNAPDLNSAASLTPQASVDPVCDSARISLGYVVS
jgi:hypothetical protein